MSDVTQVLDSIARGEPQAADKLLPLVYDELRRLATRNLANQKAGQTLQPTALVHEAYVRLVGAEGPAVYRDRGHFFAAAATAMRHILIDIARGKQTEKRGGNLRRGELEGVAAPFDDEKLLALDDALEKLCERDPPKAKLVELRYFAGLTGEQAAEVLGISPTTADRHWAYARAFLRAEIGSY